MTQTIGAPASRIACYVVTLGLQSFISGRLGLDYGESMRTAYPSGWFDGHEHTHKAIDGARGYASVLRHVLMQRSFA